MAVTGCSIEKKEQFNLRWNHFESTLSGGLLALMEEKAFVDVTLGCENQFVQAHKNILSVCSPYFKSLFNANPCKHPIVILKDIRLTELKALLQFMYRGEVSIGEDELPSLLRTADALSIKGLASINKDVINKVNRVQVNTTCPNTNTTPNQEPPRKRQRNENSGSSSPPPTVELPPHINLDNGDTIDLSNIKLEPETLGLLDVEHVSLPPPPQVTVCTDTSLPGPSNTSQSSSQNQNTINNTSEASIGDDDDAEICQEFVSEQCEETNRTSRRKSRLTLKNQDSYDELLEDISSMDDMDDSDCEYQDGQDNNSSNILKQKKNNGNRKGQTNNRVVFYPCSTPRFSTYVEKDLESGAVLLKTRDFVRECAIYLRSLKEFPVPSEYTAYAKTLVNKYPILKKLPGDFEYEYTALSNLISQKLRTLRTAEKKQREKLSRRTSRHSSVSDELTSKPTGKKQRPNQEFSDIVNSVSLQELFEILKNPNADQILILHAITKTFEARQSEMESSSSITHVLDLWPVFNQEKVIVREASLLLKNKLNDFTQKYTVMINNLAKFTGWSSYKGDIMKNEEAQLQLLTKLQAVLSKPGDNKAFNVSKVDDEPPYDSCFISPIAWICMDNDQIVEAYILAEGSKLCKIGDISCKNIVKVFLSTFHCFYEKYPSSYENIMEFIEYCILGKDTFEGNAHYSLMKEKYNKINK